MEKHYLVFWRDHARPVAGASGLPPTASVVRLMVPPHDLPKGTILEELVTDALEETSEGRVILAGVVELPAAVWSNGRCQDLAVGGRVGSLECTDGQWRVHV